MAHSDSLRNYDFCNPFFGIAKWPQKLDKKLGLCLSIGASSMKAAVLGDQNSTDNRYDIRTAHQKVWKAKNFGNMCKPLVGSTS